MAPQGVKLVASPTPYALGVTSDGYAIYQDRHFSDVYAVSLKGGTPEQIGPAWDTFSSTVVSIAGPLAVYWTGVDFNKTPTLGQLIVWSAVGRSRVLAPSSFPGVFAANASGNLIAYSDNANATYPDPDAGADGGSTAGVGTTDIFVSAPDGGGRTLIASKVTWSVECVPSLSFVGDTLVVANCPSAGLNQPAATIRSYSKPGWTPVVMNNLPAYTSVGHDQTRILYYTTQNQMLTVQSISGGPVQIFNAVDSAILTNDGTSVIFHIGPSSNPFTNGLIARSPVTSSNVQWVTSPFANARFAALEALSHDDKWLITHKTYDTNPNSPLYGLYDTYLLPTAPNSTAVPLLTTTTGAFLNDWFTTDNAYVMFGANTKPAPYAFYGDYATVPLIAPNAPPLTISKTVWSAYATKNSKTVYNDGYDIVFPSLPTADIQVVDLSNSGTRTKLVSHADANFYLNADRTKAVYSWTYCADDRAGLYVVDLP